MSYNTWMFLMYASVVVNVFYIAALIRITRGVNKLNKEIEQDKATLESLYIQSTPVQNDPEVKTVGHINGYTVTELDYGPIQIKGSGHIKIKDKK